MSENNENKRPKGKKKGRIFLIIVELAILVVLGFGLWFVLKTTGTNSKKSSGDGNNNAGGIQKINIDEKEIEVNMNPGVSDSPVLKGYRNIALFGVDSRQGQLSQKTRTDTIMVASINLDTKEIRLVSVYRDTYLNQMDSGNSYGKCNAAYAYGGAEQAIKMLNSNLDLDITDFVTIGFKGLVDVINAVGGVYIDVDSEEIKHINNYQLSMTMSTENDEAISVVENDYKAVTETGYQLLDGLQATAYCRIRYTAGNDFKRAERQREVLQATLEVAKTCPVTKLTEICNTVFDEVYTSLDVNEILELLTNLSEYKIVAEGGFPTNGKLTTGTIGTKGSCVIPSSLSENVTWLHEFLFDDANYVPTDAVNSYSDKIYSDTSVYLEGSGLIEDTENFEETDSEDVTVNPDAVDNGTESN